MAIVQKKDLFSPERVKSEIYSDFFADLDIHPVNKDLVRLTNEDAVKRSIKNLLLTNPGDIIYDNTVGSNLRKMLFEPMGPTSEGILEQMISNTIENYEPRAKLETVRVSADYDIGLLTATIVFSVINKEEPITLELILNRIR